MTGSTARAQPVAMKLLVGGAIASGAIANALRIQTLHAHWPVALLLVAWGMLPYLVLPILPLMRWSWSEIVGGTLALVSADLAFSLEAHFRPNPFIALAVISAPVFLLCFVVPAGLYVARAVGYLVRRNVRQDGAA
jgi:hypothetical protein